MTCTRIPLEGGVAFVCSRGQNTRPRECAFCRVTSADYLLCDFPLRGKRAGATCSKPMCRKCATSIGENRDLCPSHAKIAREHGLDPNLLAEDQGKFGNQVALDQLEAAGAPVTTAALNKQAVIARPKFRQRTVAVYPNKPYRVTAVGDWEEFWNERAAIGEYERGMTREESERAARELAGARPK